jgi:prepilin-type N-terminal cleavage/methylation domain-containing protein
MRKEHGFSMMEVMMVVVVVGVAVTVTAPNITRSIRSYRLKNGAQQVASAIQTAKLTAVGANETRSIFFDTVNNTIAVGNAANTVPLPSGVSFVSSTVEPPQAIKSAVDNAGSIAGQQSDETVAVSFPAGSVATVRQASFNWRGLPVAAPGAVNWVYLTNTDGELMAVTLSSSGSVDVWNRKVSSTAWHSSYSSPSSQSSTTTTSGSSSSGSGR